MKSSTFYASVAIAVLASTPAFAACPTGFTEIDLPDADLSGFDGTVEFDVPGAAAGKVCVTATNVGPNNGSIATGDFEALLGVNAYTRAHANVTGLNSSAFGNGATVGTFDPGPDGIVGTADDNMNPVANGTAIGANSSVQHDHSTAIGADATTDRENQVVLGTADDEVTVRNLPGNVADKADTSGVVVHKADGTLASDGGRMQGEIDDNTATNSTQQTEIDANTADISSNTGNIAVNTAKNVQQDDRLDGHDAVLVSHGQGIAANASDIADNAAAIASNSDAIAANSAAINENSEGVAIAMAMPDSWLSDQENFAIAGGFGGFNGETAFGAIGTARIYGGFSAYAGGGISTSGNEWGWKVGARAGF